MNKFSFEDLQKANKAVEKASESDRPYAVMKGEEVMVIGDSNDIEPKTADFNIQFRFEKDELEKVPTGAKTIMNRWVLFEQKFNDIFIAPKDDLKIVESCLTVYPFFAEYQELNDYRENSIKDIEEKYHETFKGETTSAKDKTVEDKMLKEREEVQRNFTRMLLHEYNYGQGQHTTEGMFDFVATVLGMDEYMKEHMSATSVLTAFIKIAEIFPEVFKEAETLFGLSSTEGVMN